MSTGPAALSMQQKLEDRIDELEDEDARKRRQICDLQDEDTRKRRRIRDLEREVGDLKADPIASATQQRPAVASKQQGGLISELRAKLLEKDNEIERLKSLNQRHTCPEHERRRQVEALSQQQEESLHLSVMSQEDKASESNDYWPSWPPGQMVGESKNGSSTPGQDETGDGSHDEVENSGNQNVQGREAKEAEQVREKRWIEHEGDWYQTGDSYQGNTMRYTLEPEATGKGKRAAAIEPTTAPHIGIQEQAKTAQVNPVPDFLDVNQFKGWTLEEYRAQRAARIAARAAAPGQVISDYEARGPKPP